jgi:hypothetical protein
MKTFYIVLEQQGFARRAFTVKADDEDEAYSAEFSIYDDRSGDRGKGGRSKEDALSIRCIKD